jgi:hypothetical protein
MHGTERCPQLPIATPLFQIDRMLAGFFMGMLVGVVLGNIAVCAVIGMLLGILLGATRSRCNEQ